MKKKILLLIGVVGLALGVSLNITQVKADGENGNNCHTVRNYYFFAEINDANHYQEKLPNSDSTYPRIHSTSFKALPSGIHLSDISTKGQITLVKTGDTVATTTWNLEDFYKAYRLAKGENGHYSETLSDNTEINYFLHGAWYEENAEGESNNTVDVTDKSDQELAAGSIIPSTTIITMTEGDILAGRVNRTIEYSDLYTTEGEYIDGITPFKHSYSTGGNEYDMLLTPALYYVEYEACEEVETPKYTATIEYRNKATNKKVADDYIDENLANGFYDSVTSPVIDNCTLDNPAVDKVHEYTIDNANHEYTVYYVCTSGEEVKENKKTGDALIYIVWGIGALALGYSIYYFNKYYKKEEDM